VRQLGPLLLAPLAAAACWVDLLQGERAPTVHSHAPKGFRVDYVPGGEWALERVSRDGTAIWIRFAESGCVSFDHAEVRETAKGVRVVPVARVLMPIRKHYGCLLYLRAGRYRIDLPRSLGGREVLGECLPGEATPRQRVCASMHQAAKNPF
jgi:hypothetical protein